MNLTPGSLSQKATLASDLNAAANYGVASPGGMQAIAYGADPAGVGRDAVDGDYRSAVDTAYSGLVDANDVPARALAGQALSNLYTNIGIGLTSFVPVGDWLAGGLGGLGEGASFADSVVTGTLRDAVPNEATITSGGTANAATGPQLAQQLQAENLANIASQDPRLATAVYGGGSGNMNFSIGTGTAAEADALGQVWVGDGAQPMGGVPDGLVSADGTMTYRPPQPKNSPFAFTGVQANFQQLSNGQVISNGHLNIVP